MLKNWYTESLILAPLNKKSMAFVSRDALAQFPSLLQEIDVRIQGLFLGYCIRYTSKAI